MTMNNPTESMSSANMSRTLVAQRDSGGSRLQLFEHVVEGKRELEVVMNGVFIMASYNRVSSEMLTRTALERMRNREDVRVLIGGFGMGFCAGEACRYANVSRVDIVELEPTILAWNRRFFHERNQDCLSDERVHVIVDDFHDYVCKTDNTYDAVAMDIDNGPALLVREGNRRVYSAGFFARVKAHLRPSGIFVIWSCSQEPVLEEAGLEVFSAREVETVVEHYAGREVPYFLYLWFRE